MPQRVFGRTQSVMPHVWLRLQMPSGSDGLETARPLVDAAVAAQVPLDVTSPAALWGTLLAGREAPLLVRGGKGLAQTTSSSHAADWLQAHMFETLCSLERERIQTYALNVQEPLEEHQISGALEALESARTDGHLTYVALNVGRSPGPALGAWRFHDAFDFVMVPRCDGHDHAYDAVTPLAKDRNAGVALTEPFDWGWGSPFFTLPVPGADPLAAATAAIAELAKSHPVLVPVESFEAVLAAINATVGEPDSGALVPYRNALLSPGFWERSLASNDPALRRTAARRLSGVVETR